ncbi:hypothetical protein GIB67_006890 [Kingdonia uniflora]|uniref:Uncharacterized protein n=1 Tax=Kingdonia uniflora TaxID=39325 RepID=A0A7J7L090_9MAGN|nr:hypothetical protein GIB67_006890 [Kingdonia uniflora]
MKQNCKPLSGHYSSLKGLWDQLLLHRPITASVKEQQKQWDEFMVASLLFGLDPSLRGYKDQILASETLPTVVSAYSRLARSSLGQSTVVLTSESSAFISSGGNHYRGGDHFCGGFRGSHGGGRLGGRSYGRRGRGGRGDKKCEHCGGTNHSGNYCWQKWGKPSYAKQVSENTTYRSSSVEAGSTLSPDIPAQLSELLQALKTVAPTLSPSTANLVNSGNIACVAQSPSSWVIDSGASTHIYLLMVNVFDIIWSIADILIWLNFIQVYSTMRSAFVDIIRTRGFRGMYAGLSPTLVEIIPYAGLQFGTYDTFKRWTMVMHSCCIKCFILYYSNILKGDLQLEYIQENT